MKTIKDGILQHPSLGKVFSQAPFVDSWSEVEQYLQNYWQSPNHGDHARWQAAVERVMDLVPEEAKNWEVNDNYLQLAGKIPQKAKASLEQALQQLHPWRKGPLSIGPIDIDTEWRSDWKWQRLKPHLDFTGKHVLDVGSGNGYYGFRMLDAGARSVIGIDPTLLFVMQARLMQYCSGHPNNWVLPMTLEQLPEGVKGFDIVLSLGVLYHRKDPVEHLKHLLHCVKPGGQVVIETFVLPPGWGEAQEVDRYARMRNVYQIPSVERLRQWMQQAGWENIQMVDLCRTSTGEQRSTEWMRFESLSESLSADDQKQTVEGLPRPVRCLCIAGRLA